MEFLPDLYVMKFPKSKIGEFEYWPVRVCVCVYVCDYVGEYLALYNSKINKDRNIKYYK